MSEAIYLVWFEPDGYENPELEGICATRKLANTLKEELELGHLGGPKYRIERRESMRTVGEIDEYIRRRRSP